MGPTGSHHGSHQAPRDPTRSDPQIKAPPPSPSTHTLTVLPSSCRYGPQIKATLAAMPDGRCPYPPGDVPGGGFSLGHPDYRDPKVVISDT